MLKANLPLGAGGSRQNMDISEKFQEAIYSIIVVICTHIYVFVMLSYYSTSHPLEPDGIRGAGVGFELVIADH